MFELEELVLELALGDLSVSVAELDPMLGDDLSMLGLVVEGEAALLLLVSIEPEPV
jgi:hypothetical protein